MADFRIKYGMSLGTYGNFQARTDGLLMVSSGTPDVSLGCLFYTNNSSGATNITDFTGVLAGGLAGVEEGKVITVVFLDTNTTLVNSNRMYLSSSANTFPANGVIQLIQHNSAWYEICRSKNTTSEVSNVTAAGSASFNVSNVKTLVITATSQISILSFSGGDVGQVFTLVTTSAGQTVEILANGAGNIAMAGTSIFITSNSGAYQFVRPTGTLKWNFIRAPGTL